MYRDFESVPSQQLEVLAEPPVVVTAEETVMERVSDISFSGEEFAEWMIKRGIEQPQNHPLVISLRESREDGRKHTKVAMPFVMAPHI